MRTRLRAPRGFAGEDRYIVDYLVEEVPGRQSKLPVRQLRPQWFDLGGGTAATEQQSMGHRGENNLTGTLQGYVMASREIARQALVLHDRPVVVDLIQLTLNHGMFVVRAASNLTEAEAILAEWRPDLTVIDMDHQDSTALMQRLGTPGIASRTETPVLGLTRWGDLGSKLKAFDLGVDDIMTMPFSPEELLARAIAITRRATGVDRPIVPSITLGEIEVDIVNRQVRAGSTVVHLSGIEQSLLYLLASRGGRVVAREDILDAIWGTDFVAESNLVDRHIRSLRLKLQDDYRRPRFIATVPGRGYRFIPTFSNAGWSGAGDPVR